MVYNLPFGRLTVKENAACNTVWWVWSAIPPPLLLLLFIIYFPSSLSFYLSLTVCLSVYCASLSSSAFVFLSVQLVLIQMSVNDIIAIYCIYTYCILWKHKGVDWSNRETLDPYLLFPALTAHLWTVAVDTHQIITHRSAQPGIKMTDTFIILRTQVSVFPSDL